MVDSQGRVPVDGGLSRGGEARVLRGNGLRGRRRVLRALKPLRQSSGKMVHAWAVEGDLDPTTIVSNTFEIEWPPRSGRLQSIPEIDRGAWLRVARCQTQDPARTSAAPRRACANARLIRAGRRSVLAGLRRRAGHPRSVGAFIDATGEGASRRQNVGMPHLRGSTLKRRAAKDFAPTFALLHGRSLIRRQVRRGT